MGNHRRIALVTEWRDIHPRSRQVFDIHSMDLVMRYIRLGAYKIPGFSDIPQTFNVSLLKDAEWPNLGSIKVYLR